MKTENKQNQYSRQQFLKTAGSTALFAALGIGLYGCGDNTMDAGLDDSGNDQSGPGSPSPSDGAIAGLTAVRTNNAGVTVAGNEITLDLTDETLSKLKDEGQALWLTDEKVLTVNVDGTTIRSFTAVCTHSSCSDAWSLGGGNFNCGCHGSRFNSSGKVVQEPARSDLAEFSTQRDGDNENLVTIKTS